MFDALKSSVRGRSNSRGNKQELQEDIKSVPSKDDSDVNIDNADAMSTKSGSLSRSRSLHKVPDSPGRLVVGSMMSFFRSSPFKPANDDIEDDLSDDDDDGGNATSTAGEDSSAEFIQNGAKGIIVFNRMFCVSSAKYKTFHLNINTGMISQYTDKLYKRFPCADIQEIRRNSHKQAVLKIKHNMDFSTKKSKYTFDSDQDYYRFKKSVEFMNYSGNNVRSSFQCIDKEGSKAINKASLKSALTELDISVTDSELRRM